MRGGKKVVRSKLNPGSMIRVDSGEVFTVDSVVGEGASCVVYLAEKEDGTQHLLKEYNPKRVELYRESDGTLTPEGDDAEEQYDAGLARFIYGAKKQVNMRRSISDLTNSTCNVQGIYSANGTKYIDMTVFHGQSYEKVKEHTLYDLLRRMRALARVIGCYHGNGYLHLDIKPENVFTIPETCEMVMLFDFDSVIEMSSVNSGAGLSYTKTWAAPEQICGKTSRICKATDIFPLGEIVFFQIFGRHSTDRERRSFSKYTFGEDLELCKNVNHKVFRLLEDFFHHTICISSSKRYQSVEPLLAMLDKMIPLADPKAPHLVSTQIAPLDFFIGREDEIDEITRLLQQDHILFLNGMGGIGKSELAKRYAALSEKNYDTILFLTYSGSWLTLVTDDICLNIANCSQDEGEDAKEYYYRKMQVLKSLCNSSVLIVIDNLNQDEFTDAESRMMTSFLSLNAHFLLTSRLQAWEYPCIAVDKLDKDGNGNRCLNLFSHWCPLENETEQKAAQDIIEYVDSNTLVVEVIAKQITAGFSSPSAMLTKITDKGLKSSGSEQVRMAKDMQPRKKSAFDHIRNLYNLSDLTDAQQAILVNMSIMPSRGINARQFARLCEIEDFDDINHLVNTAWLVRSENSISMHPVISDVVMSSVCKRDARLDTVLNAITNKCRKESITKLNRTERIGIPAFLLEISRNVLKTGVRTANIAVFLATASTKISSYGNLEQSLFFAKQAVEICDEISGDNNAETQLKAAVAYCNLGAILVGVGRFDEAEIYMQHGCDLFSTGVKTCKGNEDIIKEYLAEFNDPDFEVLSKVFPQMMMGFLYTQWGRLKTAKELLSTVVNDYTEKTEAFNEMIAGCSDMLNRINVLVGDENVSIKCSSNHLLTNTNEEDTDAAGNYRTDALAFSQSGRVGTAVNALRKSLAIYERWDGASSLSAASTYYELGMNYLEIGDTNAARNNLEKAQEMITEMFGDQDIRMLYIHTGYANYYLMCSEYEQARAKAERALHIADTTYGDQSKDTGDIYCLLGLICFYQADYEMSEKNFRKALAVYIDACGDYCSPTAKTCGYIGSCLALRGRKDEAKEYYKKASEICAKLYGYDNKYANIEVIMSAAMSVCLYDSPDEALEKMNQLLLTIKESNDDNTLIEACVRYSLAVAYWSKDQIAEAELECKKAISICEAIGDCSFLPAAVHELLDDILIEKTPRKQP